MTVGNSSGINDGASAILITLRELANNSSMKRKRRVIGCAAVGVDPNIMSIGPIAAINNLLNQTGYNLKGIGLIEINKAFPLLL